MPAGEEKQSRDSPAPRRGLQLMALIVVALALLSFYTNYQNAHLDEIEKITIASPPPAMHATPKASPESKPSQ